MVVGLEGRAELALGEDDEGVDDLVELAEVEDPAVKGKTLVPEAAGVELAGSAVRGKNGVGGVRDPAVGGLVEESSITETGGAIETANGLDEAREAGGTHGVHHGAAQSTEHAVESPCRVDSEEDVVGNDEPLEGSSLADGPGLLARRDVVLVEELGRDGVGDSDGDGHGRVEHGLVDIVGNVDGRCEGGRARGRWGEEGRVVVWRELEQRGRGQAHVNGGIERHFGKL